MAEQRLPVVNGDDGAWGDILNQFLNKEHYNDATNNPVNGGHQTITIRPGSATAGTAPLKFTSGTLLTTPEAGAVEFNSDSLYITQTSSTTRKKIAAYDDSGGAAGDLYYRDGSGYFVKLPIGTSSYVLTVSGGLPAWAPAGGGGGGTARSIATISTATTAGSTANTDYVYFIATAGVTLTLPTAVSNTNRYTMKNISTDVVSITTTSSQTIDGTVGPITIAPEQSIDVISDNSNWQIV